mmetsp:Transcript_13360/g.42890  ORF Transcript_13360/g.42890 Transcript_13360/m.42890 type:complete len:711 (-) Transcript_13360:103-2235(-)
MRRRPQLLPPLCQRVARRAVRPGVPLGADVEVGPVHAAGVPAARHHLLRAHQGGRRVHRRRCAQAAARLGRRPDAGDAALIEVHAARSVGAGARFNGRVPRRPGRLLHRQGAGEGHPDPGAAQQEPDHRRLGHKGQHHLGGHVVDARAEEQDTHHLQERPLRGAAQHLRRRHPRRRPPARHGPHLGPGGGAAGRLGASLCARHLRVAARVRQARHLLAGKGARVDLAQDSVRPSRRRAHAAPLAARGDARAAGARAARARPGGRLQLLAEDGVRRADAAPDDLGAARPRLHGRHGLLRQQAARAGRAAALSPLRGPLQEAVCRAAPPRHARAVKGVYAAGRVGHHADGARGHPHQWVRLRHLVGELVGQALQDGALRRHAGALAPLLHLRARHDDAHHVAVRKDAKGVRPALAAALAVGDALPVRHAGGGGVRAGQEPRPLRPRHHGRRGGADPPPLLQPRRRRLALALRRRPVHARRAPGVSQWAHPRRAPPSGAAPAHDAPAAPCRRAARVCVRAAAPDPPLCQHRVRQRASLPAAARGRQRSHPPRAAAHGRAGRRQARVCGLCQGGHRRVPRRQRGELGGDRRPRGRAARDAAASRAVLAPRDRPADHPRRVCRADPVPAPQPVAAEHVPVRDGQAGDGLDRVQPVGADRHHPLPPHLPTQADGQDAHHRPHRLQQAARRPKHVGRSHVLLGVRHRGRAHAERRLA